MISYPSGYLENQSSHGKKKTIAVIKDFFINSWESNNVISDDGKVKTECSCFEVTLLC